VVRVPDGRFPCPETGSGADGAMVPIMRWAYGFNTCAYKRTGR
jgi:hypothetical protein